MVSRRRRCAPAIGLPLLFAAALCACKTPPPKAPPRSKVVQNPSPPADVANALERFFPLGAVMDEQSGSADVLLNVKKSGVVRPRKLLNESAPGFGRACARAMKATRWNPARQEDGRYLDYRVYYTCNFDYDHSPNTPEVRKVDAAKEWKSPEHGLVLKAHSMATRGDLGPEQLGPTVGPRLPELLTCFVGAASGDYRFSFLVDAGGGISRAELVYQSGGQDRVADCVEERSRKWRVPASGPRPTLVDVPLSVRAGG